MADDEANKKEEKPEDKKAPEESSEAEANEEKSAEEASGKSVKGKRMLIIAIVAVLVLAAVGGGIYFSGILGHDKESEQEQSESAHTEKADSSSDAQADKHAKNEAHTEPSEGEHDGEHGETPPVELYQKMDDFLVNLTSKRNQPSFLKLKVVLVIPNEKIQEKVNAVMPRIRDTLQTYLRELRSEDLEGSAGLYRLRQELLLRVNKIISPDDINDILFEEILVQ